MNPKLKRIIIFVSPILVGFAIGFAVSLIQPHIALLANNLDKSLFAYRAEIAVAMLLLNLPICLDLILAKQWKHMRLEIKVLLGPFAMLNLALSMFALEGNISFAIFLWTFLTLAFSLVVYTEIRDSSMLGRFVYRPIKRLHEILRNRISRTNILMSRIHRLP